MLWTHPTVWESLFCWLWELEREYPKETWSFLFPWHRFPSLQLHRLLKERKKPFFALQEQRRWVYTLQRHMCEFPKILKDPVKNRSCIMQSFKQFLSPPVMLTMLAVTSSQKSFRRAVFSSYPLFSIGNYRWFLLLSLLHIQSKDIAQPSRMLPTTGPLPHTLGWLNPVGPF